MKFSDAEAKNIGDLISWWYGAFYQTWDLDEPGGMLGILSRECTGDLEKDISALSAIFREIEHQSSVSEFLHQIGGDYDPKYDNLTIIEWLVLVKHYMLGNKDVFNHIPSIMSPYLKWKSEVD